MVVDYNVDIRGNIEETIFSTFPDVPIAWQGLDFDPPTGLWIRPFAVLGAEMPYTYEGDKLVGALVFECFNPLNDGSRKLFETINRIRSIFYRRKINNLYFRSIQGVRDLSGDDQFLGKAIDFEFEGYSNI